MQESTRRTFVGATALVLALAAQPRFGRADVRKADQAPAPAAAEGAAAPSAPDGGTAAEEGPKLPWQPGPKSVELGHDIALQVPTGYRFLAQPEAGQVMEQMGNLHNENMLGVVVGEGESPWFLVLSFDEEGYVKDDESIDAEELLSDMREAVEELNVERKQRGFLELKLDGWDENPHYDRQAHQLVWSLRVSDAEGSSSNYNTRILGRKGYVSVNLVTDPARVATDKQHASAILAATQFKQGARYQDFDASSDKVAEYGLAGLIAGGAGLGAMKLVKLGLFAKFWKVLLALLIAGKKAIIPLVIAAGYGIKKLFGAKGGDNTTA